MVTPAAKRKAVSHLIANHGMSERRACKAIGGCRMTVRYNSRRPDDAVLRERMMMIARKRRRFGYRRLLVLLRREGHVVNHKKTFPALPRGKAGGSPSQWPKTGYRHAGAGGEAAGSQRVLGARLYV